MISVSRLLCGYEGPGDHLRYRKNEQPRPVVVWNCIRRCNLSCLHCYAAAGQASGEGVMDTAAGKRFIDGLADFGVPVIIFSGGEPLLRPDLFELAGYAHGRGLRIALSTNGTLIDAETAVKIKQSGFVEAGISLDGIGANNDRFRGKSGAFQSALEGIRSCISLGVRVSLRLTMTSFNYREIPDILSLAEAEGIDRICFYHLAYSGRGDGLRSQDITHEQTRWALDEICRITEDMHRRGLRKEVLTVDNHADGVYFYLKLLELDPGRAEKARELLAMNGGNNSGLKISSVDEMGNVHPDQFWQHYSLGNVLRRSFGDVWTDTTEPLLKGLRDRRPLLKGRCARCRYLELCNGNLRVRAEAVYGDVWAQDPACYLTDEEIGIS